MKKRKTTEDYLKTIYLLSAKGEVRGVDKETAVNDICMEVHSLVRYNIFSKEGCHHEET